MKKYLLIFCIILLSLIGALKIQKNLQKQYFLSKLKGKYFITIHHLMEKKSKIIIFNGKTKILEIDAKDATSILSIENGKIIYLETLTDEGEIKKVLLWIMI